MGYLSQSTITALLFERKRILELIEAIDVLLVSDKDKPFTKNTTIGESEKIRGKEVDSKIIDTLYKNNDLTVREIYTILRGESYLTFAQVNGSLKRLVLSSKITQSKQDGYRIKYHALKSEEL